jgi:AAA15 family ATPase/GTPase
METIRIKNLRSLEDTSDIKLSPITLLVGKNGSGKSTFARFFMLLRQSIESRTKGPLLWYGDHVDFGSFEESHCKSSTDDSIYFSLSIPLVARETIRHPMFYLEEMSIIENYMANIEFRVKGTKDNKTYLDNLKIEINKDTVNIGFDRNAKLASIDVNGVDISSFSSKYESIERLSFFPYIRPIRSSQSEKMQRHLFGYNTMKDQEIIDSISKDLTDFCHGKVKNENIKMVAMGLAYGDKVSFLTQLKKIKTLGNYYQQNISQIRPGNKKIEDIRQKVLALLIPSLLVEVDEYLTSVALNISYIEPVRAGIVRFYREQDLSVAEIDPIGRNLPMFLRNLSETEKKDFSQWTLNNLGFEVKALSKHGQIALHLTEEGCTQDYNLADMGFGFSQILPIVAQLWILIRKGTKTRRGFNLPKILSIEQPELHLHPDRQAKVADMFVAAIKLARKNDIDLRLVIETHSETIINRIGNLIYQKKLSPSDAGVVLFEKRYADKSAEISISGYDSEGCLQNWPYGFFQPEEG